MDACKRLLFPLLSTLGLLGLLLPAGCARDQAARFNPADAYQIVRVRLLGSQQRVSLSASRPALVRGQSESNFRTLRLSELAVPVTLGTAGWQIGATPVGGGLGELTIRPSVDGSVAVNGQRYHGQYRLVPVGQNRFDVVNDVYVDDYLKGVVSRELLSYWDEETYKAQAIVARTYALYESRTAPTGRAWDVYPDERSQVYGGIAAETSKSIRSVDATRGIVLVYGPPGQQRIFKAYFSACCGGISQSAYDAFGDAWSEPLWDQYRGNMCSASPTYNWGPITIGKDELTRRIRAWGARRNLPEQGMADLVSIDIQSVNRFGRPVRFVLTDAHGARYSLSGEDTRTAINTDAGSGSTVYSSFFRPITPAQTPEVIQFIDGHGHGHGVGMCQWCAQARAQQGQRAAEIVLSFYPHAKLARAY